MALGDPIPNVSDGELIRTTWGDAVADEINNNTVKKSGAQTMAGPLTVSDAILANNHVQISDTPTAANHATRKDYVDSTTVSLAGDTMTGLLKINPTSGTVGIRLIGSISAGASLLECYSSGEISRYAYVNGVPSGLNLAAAEGSSGIITFLTDSGGLAERMRLHGTTLLIGKTAADSNSSGVEIPAGGHAQEGMIVSTTASAGLQNAYLKHVGTADANNQAFITFVRSGADTGIGSIAQGSGDFTVFNAGAGGSHIATSDYRLKDELGPIDDPVGRLMQLQPKRLRWNDQSGTDGEFDGFIAHEVTPVAPNAVVGEKDAVYPQDHPTDPGGIDAQGIDEKKLVPLLTAALQDAHTKIADLTARLDALEAA